MQAWPVQDAKAQRRGSASERASERGQACNNATTLYPYAPLPRWAPPVRHSASTRPTQPVRPMDQCRRQVRRTALRAKRSRATDSGHREGRCRPAGVVVPKACGRRLHDLSRVSSRGLRRVRRERRARTAAARIVSSRVRRRFAAITPAPAGTCARTCSARRAPSPRKRRRCRAHQHRRNGHLLRLDRWSNVGSSGVQWCAAAAREQ